MKALEGRILVTGGAGFIGSALIWALNQKGMDNIIVCDLLGTDEKWKNLVPLSYVDYIEADVFRKKITLDANAFGEFSCVFHLGACSATTEKNATYLIDNNYQFTKELALWAIARNTRFIYASSAATYGDGEQGMSDQIKDLNVLRPLNMYAYSKQLFDLYAQRHGLSDKIVGLKYFNVFGPNENHKGEMRSLVNKAYDHIKNTGKVQLFKSYRPEYKDGEQMRDFLYVKDAVEMTIHLADQTNNACGLYNLGSGEANTWKTLAESIFEALELPINIEYIEMPEALKGKYQYYTLANIEKIRKSGYSRPMTPLAVAIKDYVINYMRASRRLGE